jgi:putative (di)nucleoside polyphosphate hydrolase
MTEERLTPAGLRYRPCVGIVLINDKGQVWLGKRTPSKTVDDFEKPWQLPQGGIDKGESPQDAVMRELWEEVGTRKARIIAEAQDWLYYDLPPDVLSRKKRNNWGGQKQKYFALKFLGEDSDVDLEVHHPEFIEWRWAEIEELPDLAVPFKRAVYEQVVEEFTPVIANLRK